MSDPLSIAAGVVGLVGVVKTCIDLYDIITTCVNVSRDLQSQVIKLQTERIRFFMWCSVTGFAEIALQCLAQGKSPTPDLRHTVATLLAPGLDRTIFLDHIEKVMTEIQLVLRAAQKAFSFYTDPGEAKFLPRLKRRRHPEHRNLALVEVARLSAALLQDAKAAPASRIWDGLKWGLKGRKEIMEMIDDLRRHNDGLESILNSATQARLLRAIDMVVSDPSTATLLLPQQNFDQGLHQRDRILLMSKLSKQTQALGQLDEGGAETAAQASLLPHLTVAFDLNGNLEIDRAELHLPRQSQFPEAHRECAFYKDQQPVLVEWRYYSSKSSSVENGVLDARVHMLSLQLRDAALNPDFHVLACIGYFHQQANHRYGIVFAYPFQLCTPVATVTPISLRERLGRDFKDKVRRDLGDRLRTARAVTSSVFRLLCLRWLHKNIRSENVLLFEQDQDKSHLAPAYLCGFGFSRRNAALEMTESLPTVVHNLSDSREWQLYRHPDLIADDRASQASSTHLATASLPRSNMLHDVYSLGIVLLEIALWYPIIKLCPRELTVPQFQKDLLKEYHSKYESKIRFNLGERFSQVVLLCLNGGFSEEERRGAHSGESLGTQLFLEAFERLVSTEVEAML